MEVYHIIIVSLIFGFYSSSNTGRHVVCKAMSSFLEVVDSPMFVDKTMMLIDFMDDCGKLTMITAPRRFGKSTNMDMMKRFLNVREELYENGKIIKKEETTNYKLFTQNSLHIHKYDIFFDLHFARYPVIYMNFGELHCSSYHQFIHGFKEVLREAFTSYYETLFKYKKKGKEIFEKYLIKEKSEELLEDELLKGVRHLSRFLRDHYKNNSIILIDEFDAPVHRSITQQSSDIEKIINFMKEFVEAAFISNTFLEKALISTSVRLANIMTSQYKDINHITFVSDSPLYGRYGLTELEVKYLLESYELIDNHTEVTLWYNGYQVGEYCKIYNLYDVVNYLKNRKLDRYWAQKESIQNIKELFTSDEIREKIELLLDDFESRDEKGIKINYLDEISIEYLNDLKQFIHKNNALQEDLSDVFLQYLTDDGYFHILDKGHNYAYISIPNMGVKVDLELKISSDKFYKRKFTNHHKEFVEIPELFNGIDKSRTGYLLITESVERFYSNREVAPKNELRLLRDLHSAFKMSRLFKKIKREIDVKRKRYSIYLRTKDEKAIVIELGMKTKTAVQGLKQIIVEEYYNMIDQKNLKSKILLGLNIDGHHKCTISYLYNSLDLDKAVGIDPTNPYV